MSADIGQNVGWITRQMYEAARHGARVAYFPEGALSGYAGADFETFTGYDWDALDHTTGRVRERAADLGIWDGHGVRAPVQRRQRAAQQPVRDSATPVRSPDAMTSGSSAAPTWIISARAATSAPGPSTGSGAGHWSATTTGSPSCTGTT